MVDVFKKTAQFARTVLGLEAPDQPTRLNPTRKDWAVAAFNEEVYEFLKADTLEDEVDACIDLIYFAAGRLHEMGVDGAAHFLEVHNPNMRKVRGELSKRPGSQGYDAVKPDGWVGPDHGRVLRGPDVGHPGHPPYHFVGADAEAPSLQSVEPARPRIVLLGHARHGKDTVAEMLRDRYGYRFESSSMFCAEKVLMPYFNGLPSHRGYASVEECFEDRVNYRDVWFQQIELYNYPDRSRLAREMFERNDVYVGMRSKRELAACRNAGVVDLVVWVDASDRLPPEDSSSCTVEPWMADLVVDNNGTLEELALNVFQLVEGQGL